VFLTYQREFDPITPEMDEGRKIHHAIFGQYLKQRLDALGVECTWTYKDDGRGSARQDYWKMIAAFFLKHFDATGRKT
jgi:hypothetical protein